MNFLSRLGVASIALIVTSCGPKVQDAEPPASSRYDDVTDFNGEWQLVTDRSDDGREWLDESDRFGVDDWGDAEPTTDRVRYRAWFLPDVFRIEGDRGILRIEDESGDVIAELDLDDGLRSDDDGYDADRSNRRGPRARWMDDRRFEVRRVGRNGRRITQTFALEDRGRRLVVGTRVERDGSTRRSFSRVYERS